MLTFKMYTKAIDVWSVGCILAEMLSGRALFPGKDYHQQIDLILNVIGSPTPADLFEISSTRSREYLKSLPFKRRQKFKEMFPMANPLALSLMERCLAFSPKNRITVEQALEHEYLDPYHDAR